MTTLWRRLAHLFRRSQADADLREEMEAHRALRQDAFERDGLAPDDAAHASRRALGNVALALDDARDVWAIRTLDSLGQDVRVALRGLGKSPGFALVAIGTLALGIGANTALFSIFSSLILRPLPVRDPGSLALLSNGSWSYPIWKEIEARQAGLFDGAFAWSSQSFDLAPGGQSDPVDGAYVSGRLFDVLCVATVRGRTITPADDGGAAPDGPVAVISHRLWRHRFRGRRGHRRAPPRCAARAVHHRGRDAARVLRSGRRPGDGRDTALCRRAAPARSGAGWQAKARGGCRSWCA